MVYIRADANEVIGSGHVMRCLSIAGELKRQGEEVTFIIADKRSEEMILEKGFSVVCLHSVWARLEQELSRLLQVIKERQISILMIDSYYVTEYYLQSLHQYTKLVYIDDLYSFLYPVDLLINYTIGAERLGYEAQYKKAGIPAKFALGCKYVPLRDEFQDVHREQRERVLRIMVTSGGTDSYNVIGNLLEALSYQEWFAEFQYDIIIGRFNKNRTFLEEHWKPCKNVHFFCNVSNISEFMKQCDIAVTASGSTVYELCACGIPSILYTFADNQFVVARSVSGMGLLYWAGDVRKDMEACMMNIISEIGHLKEDKEERFRQSHDMMLMADGKGCARIAKRIREIGSNSSR